MKCPASKQGVMAALLIFFVLAGCEAGAQTVYTWTAGDIVTGTIMPSTVSTVTAVDTLNISSANDHDFNGALITNNGTVNWSAGNLRSGNGGTITNNAAWNDSLSGFQINNAYAGAGTSFINAATGTYNKTGGTTDFTVGFTNAGKVSVTSGTLNLDAGGSFADGSVVGSSGSGVLQLLGGTLAMNGNITAMNFLFNGGTLAGNQNFVASTLNWQTGDWNSANTTTLASNSTLNLMGGGNLDFNGHAVVNNGTVNWVTGNLRSGNGGIITNNAAWNDSGNGYQINNAFGGSGTSFVNAAGGTYLKTTGTTDFTIGFTNAGKINVTGGTLNLDAGGTFAGGSVVGSSGLGVLQLLGGTLTMSGNITATNFLFNGGTLAGDQTFTGSTLNWQAGDWNSANTTTLASNSTLNLMGGGNLDFNGHAVVNNGTVNWVTGNLRSGNGGIITNNATWNDSSNGFQINNAFGGSGTSFVNAAGGTYLKTTGTTDFEVPFTNYGVVSVTGGTLNLDVGGTFYGGSSIGSTGSGVVQLLGGVLSGGGTGTFTATNFLLTSGELAGNMTFLGTTIWVGSDFNTAGTATIGATGILNITAANNHDFSGHSIVNNGTVNWTAGNIRSGNGGIITNNATWNDSSDTFVINDAYSGSGTTFVNSATGVYNKTIGTTTLADNVLVNNGTISVTGGVLNLVGGVLNSGSSIGSSGTGVVQLTSSILTANGTVNVQNFLLNGGELTGTQTFVGSLSWLAGDLNLAGAMTIANTSTLTIATGNNHDFSGHSIVNNGTVNWTAGNLRSGNGGIITNNATWNDSSDTFAINNAYSGSGSTFLNATTGVYNKTTGTTTLADNVLVNNGTISVTGGVLNLVGGVLNTGSSIGSSGSGVVQLTSGLLTANGTINVQSFLFNGGEITGVQDFAGSLSWLNGDLNAAGTMFIANGSTLTIANGGNHDFSGHVINNYGTVNWVAGTLRSGNGGIIINNGIWNDSSDTYAINNAYGGSGTNFVNAAGATYNKTGGVTSLQVSFGNLGVVNVTGGTLAFTSPFANPNGTVSLANGANFSSSNPLAFGSGSLLTGDGIVTAPSVSMSGEIKPGSVSTAGLLTLNANLSLLAPAFTDFVLGGVTQGVQYDYLAVNGNVSLGGTLQIGFIGGFNTTVNSSMTFDLISSTSLSNSFGNVANGSRLFTADGLGSFVVNYGAGSNFGVNDVVLTSFQAVPEPSTWALLVGGTGLMAVAFRRRRRAG